MKGACSTVALGVLLALATPGWAQTTGSPTTRSDVTGTLGWFNGQKSVPDNYNGRNDWYNRSLYAGVGAGWYWTDNWKTEVEGGATTEGELRGTQLTFVGRQTTIYSTYAFRTARLAVGQQYQFLHNAWVHPFVGGGIDFTWESIDQSDEIFPPAPNSGPQVVNHPRRREFHARPFATLGLKAYMTPRGFFRTDMRFVANSHGLDEVTLRFGFGIDF